MILVTVEGGIVQSISTDDPSEVGKSVAVIDYDTEGLDEDMVCKVPQGSRLYSEAFVQLGKLTKTHRWIARFLRKVEGKS